VITLHANNPDEVVSASSFEVLLGEPAVLLMIFSGIARPAIRINDDDHVYHDEVIVKLGVNVSVLIKAVSQVGLASIANAETAFTFATDAGSLEVEPGTGELQLRVQTGVRGEESYLHRFSYQIVAHVNKVAARISGTIRIPRGILDFTTLQPPQISAQFLISANRVEVVPPDPNGGVQFQFERVTPVASGFTGAVRSTDTDCFVDYAIDGCPYNTPLRVLADVASGSQLSARSAICGQVAGPRPVLLTNVAPEANGVDFAVGRLDIR
jgi:hypothetical protein